jgi:hypothetical protein
MASPSPRHAAAEGADTWRLASLVARIESHPHRAEELRRAIRGPSATHAAPRAGASMTVG